MSEKYIEQAEEPLAEFHRPVAVDQISSRKEIRIKATEDECEALAKRCDLLALGRLEAVMTIQPLAGGRLIALSGEFSADVTQSCVVTLEPVHNNITEIFEMTFSGQLDHKSSKGDLVIAYEDDDPPETIVDGVIDMGEAVTQHLSVALDPFPRSPKAEDQVSMGDDVEEQKRKDNPFAVLAALKEKGS